jgi:mRNA-degrading endonuclease RelE of RelBE toxin-antitoxin system
VPLIVRLTKQAADFLGSLDRKTKEAIKKHIADLAVSPMSFPLSKPLRQRPERCCRVGNYRILFLVEANPEKKSGANAQDQGSMEDKDVEDILLIASIGHRRDVYE